MTSFLTSDGYARIVDGAMLIGDSPCAEACCEEGCPAEPCCTVTSGASTIYKEWTHDASAYVGQQFGATDCNPLDKMYGSMVTITGYANATTRTVYTSGPFAGTTTYRRSEFTFNGNTVQTYHRCGPGIGVFGGPTLEDTYGVVGTVRYTTDLVSWTGPLDVYAVIEIPGMVNSMTLPNRVQLSIRPFSGALANLSIGALIPWQNAYTADTAPRCSFSSNLHAGQPWTTFSTTVDSVALTTGTWRVIGDNVPTGAFVSGGTAYADDVDVDVEYEMSEPLYPCDYGALLSQAMARVRAVDSSIPSGADIRSVDPTVLARIMEQQRAMGISCCGG